MFLWDTFYQLFPVNKPWLKKPSAYESNYITFTHSPVLAQYVACWTFTLVRAERVNAAEGTQERILGTLIDIWTRNRSQQVTIVLQGYKDCRLEATVAVILHTFTGHHWPRLKAVITCALKPTDDVDACAVAAGISNITLIRICVKHS